MKFYKLTQTVFLATVGDAPAIRTAIRGGMSERDVVNLIKCHGIPVRETRLERVSDILRPNYNAD